MRQGCRIRAYMDVLVACPGRSTVTLSRRARTNEQANAHAISPAKYKNQPKTGNEPKARRVQLCWNSQPVEMISNFVFNTTSLFVSLIAIRD